MINVQISDFTTIIAFWLIFSRMLPIIVQIPIFDNVSVPMPVKILTTVVLSYAFFPYVSKEIIKDINYVGVDNFWTLTIFNTLVGIIIGYLMKSIMTLFLSAGTIMTQQMGFSALRYFDPTAGSSIGPYEKLIQWTVLILVISTGALIPMFKGMFASFSTIHIYDWGKFAVVTPYFVNFFKSIFMSALMLASPLVVTNVIVMSVLGVIARTVPQMNVLMVSFVINIGMGLLIFLSISEEFFQVGYKMYSDKLGEWFNFVV